MPDRTLMYVDQFTNLLNQQTAIAAGVASVGALAAGQTKQVDVTIKPTMPDTNYSAAAIVFGDASIIGSMAYISHTIVSPSVVRVTVKNNALISLSTGSVQVTAVKG